MNSQVIKSSTKRSFLALVVMFLGFSVTMNATEYVVDKAASKVKWEAKKVTGQHSGSISFANGSITGTGNEISDGTFVIDMKSMADEDITDAGMKAKLMGHPVSYTHLRAHETRHDLVCRLLLE